MCGIFIMVSRLAVLSFLFVCLGCAKSLEKQAQDQVRTFAKASLGQEQVKVENIRDLGDHAVAEVQITTGVKMIKKDGEWFIEEVRIGDRHWEKAEDLLTLVREKRSENTLQKMDQIAKGIARYSKVQRETPQVTNFEELMDLLSPRFLERIIRIDGWANPFSYQTQGRDNYDLRSAGPDGALKTADDLVNSTQKGPTENILIQ